MNMRTRWGAAGAAVILVVVAMVASCSGSSPAGLASSCSINSDCNNPLICAFAKCHTACKDSARDCPSGQRCVTDGVDGVCELPQELSCAGSSRCPSMALVCAADQECRTPCVTNSQCFEAQTCVTAQGSAGAGACYDNSELGEGGASPVDGSGSGDAPASAETSSGQDAAGGSDGGATGADAGPDTGTGNSCPTAQTQFGFIAHGDANPNFTSGVGVRTGSQLLIFSGYSGPPTGSLAAAGDGGDGGTVNAVFVQAFDPMTSMSLGPPSPLFSAPDGAGFILDDVAINPAGQIALAFNYGGFAGTAIAMNSAQIYAAFLAPAADAGAAGLQLGQIVQLESATSYQQPHVIWSVASQAFVFSWEYRSSQWFLRIAKFLPDGRAAGGNTDVVPTDVPGGAVNSGDIIQGGVGTSGDLFAVGFVSSAVQYPWLSFLDKLGNQVGSPVQLKSAGGGSYFVTTAGTTKGFVGFYDNPDIAGVSEAFVPSNGDGGIVPPADGGDAGLAGFNFPGAMRALDMRAVSDDTGGPGGIGAVALFQNGASFVYVNADGVTHAGPNSVLSQTHTSGDLTSISNYRGSFAVSLYSAQSHSTQMAASGCH